MITFLLQHEASVRFWAFALVLLAMALWELVSPRRKRIYKRTERWPGNLLLIIAGTLFLRVFFPLLAVDMALLAEARGGGFFNLVAWPPALEILLSILILDLVVYGQHVAFHRYPKLWRLHQVHHTDRDLDATSALRFHPFEIGLSMILKIAVVIVIGPPAIAVILFEIILNATAMFNHANVALPAKIDAALRRIIVTPDMHRIHHSIDPREFNTNYGFNLSVWDRLFATYTEAPKDGQETMTLGQSAYLTHEPRSLWFMLALPFWRKRQ